MKAYAESFLSMSQEELRRGSERERERELRGDGLGELCPRYINKFSIYREDKR